MRKNKRKWQFNFKFGKEATLPDHARRHKYELKELRLKMVKVTPKDG